MALIRRRQLKSLAPLSDHRLCLSLPLHPPELIAAANCSSTSISVADLETLEFLGQGNGGKVYKENCSGSYNGYASDIWSFGSPSRSSTWVTIRCFLRSESRLTVPHVGYMFRRATEFACWRLARVEEFYWGLLAEGSRKKVDSRSVVKASLRHRSLFLNSLQTLKELHELFSCQNNVALDTCYE
ncbi:hypothetical protein C1H46_004775 [Malus baccata]|uniref:Uncharacterized protein n=1 Tax=Malus baccata TaxID=106549 RepID=A0A540NEY5_MALBA|nr:hypothetical protein C1H46_004775 [Malus baccata]